MSVVYIIMIKCLPIPTEVDHSYTLWNYVLNELTP